LSLTGRTTPGPRVSSVSIARPVLPAITGRSGQTSLTIPRSATSSIRPPRDLATQVKDHVEF
jgi:hypothetical protein